MGLSWEELANSTAITDHSNMLKPYMEVLILSVLHVPPEKHPKENGVKADFLSWQKSLAYSLRIFVDNFSFLSPLQRVLAAWFKIFN